MKIPLYFFYFFFFISCSINLKPTLDTVPIVKMKRSACYGTCPQYTVTIYEDGLIVYNGVRFVKRIGCFFSHLESDQVEVIISQIKSMSFFELKNIYLSPVTDIPSVITEVCLDGKSHKVVDRLEGPENLKNFYTQLDSLIDSIPTWKVCLESS